MKTIFFAIVCIAPAILLFAGCAHNRSEQPATYSSLPPPNSTSDNSNDRVYATSITAPGGAKGTIVHGSRGGGDNADADIAQNVEKTVLSDPRLAPYPSKVTATMDPTVKGKVILTGMVPTQTVKKNLVEHVRQVAGVTEVEDNLVLGVPKLSRETDAP